MAATSAPFMRAFIESSRVQAIVSAEGELQEEFAWLPAHPSHERPCTFHFTLNPWGDFIAKGSFGSVGIVQLTDDSSPEVVRALEAAGLKKGRNPCDDSDTDEGWYLVWKTTSYVSEASANSDRNNAIKEVELAQEMSRRGLRGTCQFVLGWDDPIKRELNLITSYGGECMGKKALVESRAQACTRQVFTILRDLQVAGYVHNDIKPANLCADSDGNVKVIDFNLAERVNEQGEGGEVGGTPAFMSPEQASRRSVNHLSDVYGAAMTIADLILRPHRVKSWYSRIKEMEIYESEEFWNDSLRSMVDEALLDATAEGRISHLCYHFLHRALEPMVEKRMSASEALQHRWIAGSGRNDASPGVSLVSEIDLEHSTKWSLTSSDTFMIDLDALEVA